MEQGDTNTLGTLARLISSILGHHIGASVSSYFDNMFTHNKRSPEDNIQNINALIEVLKLQSLYRSMNKSDFCFTKIEYLGSIVYVPTYTIST